MNSSPSDLCHAHSGDLSCIITPTFISVMDALYKKDLILVETYNNILIRKGKSGSLTSSELVDQLQRQLQAHGDPHQYLVDICYVLRNQQHQRLNEITTSY